ncbi:MAG TPA: CD225/dispanin family protein [Egibacteraceae bacterium]|nr:CD225/dispanin family protein [Egibacteraceae bacterium]
MSTTPPSGQPPDEPDQTGGQGWSTPPPGSWSTAPPPAQPPYGGGYGQPTSGQPGYGYPGQGPVGAPPPNHLVWAILTTVFCCLPFGIPSIVFAAQVNGKWAAGDVAGAQRSSDMAKKWAIASAATGLVVIVGYFALIAIGIAGGMQSGQF